MSKHKYTPKPSKYIGTGDNCQTFGVREYAAAWEDIQNDLKNGEVRIIRPTDIKSKPN